MRKLKDLILGNFFPVTHSFLRNFQSKKMALFSESKCSFLRACQYVNREETQRYLNKEV